MTTTTQLTPAEKGMLTKALKDGYLSISSYEDREALFVEYDEQTKQKGDFFIVLLRKDVSDDLFDEGLDTPLLLVEPPAGYQWVFDDERQDRSPAFLHFSKRLAPHLRTVRLDCGDWMGEYEMRIPVRPDSVRAVVAILRKEAARFIFRES